MGPSSLDVPVVIFIFNRPKTTDRVLKRIAQVQPPELYVVADGPRSDHPEDKARCQEARSLINNYDWNGEVRRKYANRNLGLVERIPSGLDWVFDQSKKAIILEDDCVPTEGFFRFCDILLKEYADVSHVMDITGHNPVGWWKADKQDYHFSYQGGIWGWATWRDAWEKYDPNMSYWDEPEIRERICDVWADETQFEHYARIFDLVDIDEVESWAYQWSYTRLLHSGLSIVPSVNQVTNIGFGERATNTTDPSDQKGASDTHPLSFPLEVPNHIAVDRAYDRQAFKARSTWYQRNRLYRWARDWYCHLFRGYPRR